MTLKSIASDGGDSDMELSSGGETSRSGTDKYYENDDDQQENGKEGADFIGFEDSGDEDFEYTPRSKTEDAKTISHGVKRTRSELSDDSDADGPTRGPPPGCPWMGHRNYTKMKSASLMLTQELRDFVDYISPTREEHQVRKYVARRLESVIKDYWKDAEVAVFGSFETKLYLPTSDMDIVVIRNHDFVKGDLYKLSGYLRSKGAVDEPTVIAHAKVPIIKCKEAISGIPVDISFNVTNGIKSAEVITNFLREIPGMHSMTVLIKYFLMIKGHNEVFNGGLGSYTTVLMILSFLQMHPEVQKGRVKVEDNLGVFLIEFFELYGIFYNYSRVGLKVTDGGRYFDKVSAGFKSNNMGRGGPELLLTSIDPNDPDNDTARGSYLLKKVREVFVGAYGTLTRSVQDRQRTLFPGQNQVKTHVRFDSHNRVAADSVQKSHGLHKNNQVSLIKDVFSISRDFYVQRQHIEDVFYSGVFQKIFGDPEGIQGLDMIEKKLNKEMENKSASIQIPAVMDNAYMDLQYFIFNSIDYGLKSIPYSKQTKKALNAELQVVLDEFKQAKIEAKDTSKIFRFAMLAVELTFKTTISSLARLRASKKSTDGPEREKAFREAYSKVKTQFESAGKHRRSVLVYNLILSESDILEAAMKIKFKSPPRIIKAGNTNGSLKNSSPSNSLRDVEFIPVDDSDAGEDEYYDKMMKEGENEYGDSDSDYNEERQGKSTGHSNPKNVNVSGGSIQLPQLTSSPRYQAFNGPQSGQNSKKNTPRTTPRGSPRESPKNSPRV